MQNQAQRALLFCFGFKCKADDWWASFSHTYMKTEPSSYGNSPLLLFLTCWALGKQAQCKALNAVTSKKHRQKGIDQKTKCPRPGPNVLCFVAPTVGGRWVSHPLFLHPRQAGVRASVRSSQHQPKGVQDSPEDGESSAPPCSLCFLGKLFLVDLFTGSCLVSRLIVLWKILLGYSIRKPNLKPIHKELLQ